MVVDAVSMLDELLPLNMIGIKKVQGGSLEDSVLVRFAFKSFYSLFSPHNTKGKIYDLSMQLYYFTIFSDN
jgi:hypothetical protein